MAATTLDVTQANQLAGAPLDMDGVDGTNGNKFRNNPMRTYLVVRNGSGASITVTIAPTRTTIPGNNVFPQSPTPTIQSTVAAGAINVLGPFPAAYNDGDGYVGVTFSSATTVTADVFETGGN